MATVRRSLCSAKTVLVPLFVFVHRMLELGETPMLDHAGEEKEGLGGGGLTADGGETGNNQQIEVPENVAQATARKHRILERQGICDAV